MKEFRACPALSPAQVLAQFADSRQFEAGPPLAQTWRLLAEQRLARQKRGEIRYGLLQRCSLWFEHAWFAAHEGDSAAARQSLAQLDAELPGLPARDKAFFSEARHCLPREVAGL